MRTYDRTVAARWSGRLVAQERARLGALLPLPCARCGREVTPDMAWHVDHLQARAQGGGHDPGNLGVAHARCNMSAGSALGRARRRARVLADARIRPW